MHVVAQKVYMLTNTKHTVITHVMVHSTHEVDGIQKISAEIRLGVSLRGDNSQSKLRKT